MAFLIVAPVGGQPCNFLCPFRNGSTINVPQLRHDDFSGFGAWLGLISMQAQADQSSVPGTEPEKVFYAEGKTHFLAIRLV